MPETLLRFPVYAASLPQIVADPSLLIEALVEQIGEDWTERNVIAVRGIYAPEVNKTPRRSWNSVEGETATRLPGVSALLVSANWSDDPADLIARRLVDALTRIRRFYGDAEYIAVLRGSRAEAGNDIGEAVLIDARVIGYIRRHETIARSVADA